MKIIEFDNNPDSSYRNVCKKRLLVPFIWLLNFLFLPVLGSQNLLDVSPQIIDLGQTVTIRINRTIDLSAQCIRILSPSGKIYSPVPEKKTDHYELSFSETRDRGFLNDNWNQYKVDLLDRHNEIIESACFYIKQERKELFFTVYVDDIGGGGYLNKAGEQWFKGLGGRINYGYENDEWARSSLSSVISRYKNRGDSIFYHFHPLEFSKEKFFLKVNHILKWKQKKDSINKLMNIEFRDRHFILLIVLFSVLSLGFLAYRRNKASYLLFFASLILIAMFFSAIYSSQMVLNQRHWNIKYSDKEWCRQFLLEAKKEFENNQLPFPHILRFGFNIPPRGLSHFYLAQMGVLADASLVFPKGVVSRFRDDRQSENRSIIYEQDKRVILQQLGQYSYPWPTSVKLPLPFYTDIRGEVNEPFDGEEINRGILEMPLTFENICDSDAYEVNYGIIDRLPSGALVSTYIHPGDDLRCLKDVIMYLQDNHDLTFISALDYLKTYMSHAPRPVLVDLKQKKAFWAYFDGRQLIPISESDSLIAKSEELMLQIENLPPYLGLIGGTLSLGEMKERYVLITDNDEAVAIYKLKNKESN